jgi:hypothetical protein
MPKFSEAFRSSTAELTFLFDLYSANIILLLRISTKKKGGGGTGQFFSFCIFNSIKTCKRFKKQQTVKKTGHFYKPEKSNWTKVLWIRKRGHVQGKAHVW